MVFYELESIIIILVSFLIGYINGNTNTMNLYFFEKRKAKKRNLHNCSNNLNDTGNELLNKFDVFFNYSVMLTNEIKSGINYNEANDITNKNISSMSIDNADGWIGCFL